MAIWSQFRNTEIRGRSDIVKVDSVGPVGAACDRYIAAVRSDEKCVVVVGHRQVQLFADCLTVGVGRCNRDRVIAYVAAGRGARDDAGMGVDAEAGRQRGREGQGVACRGSGKVAGDVEREGLAFIGALVRDRGRGRPAVADGKMEALADRLTMGVGRRDRDRVGLRNCGDGERTVLSSICSPVRTEGLDKLIGAVLVEYIVFKIVRREQDAAVVK